MGLFGAGSADSNPVETGPEDRSPPPSRAHATTDATPANRGRGVLAAVDGTPALAETAAPDGTPALAETPAPDGIDARDGIGTRDGVGARDGIGARDGTPPPGGTDALATVPTEPSPGPDAVLEGLGHCLVYAMVHEPDDTRRLTYVSANVARLFGLKREAVLADASLWTDMLAPEDRSRVANEEARASREGDPFAIDATFLTPHGRRVFNMTASPERLASGAVRWTGVATDVTRLSEERDERLRLSEVLEAGDAIVATLSTAGELTYMNPAARRWFGLDASPEYERVEIARLVPRRLHSFYLNTVLACVVREGAWSGEGAMIDGDGHERVVHHSFIAHRRADGQITHVSAIVRDRTERAALEDMLRETQARTETTLREVNHRVKNLFALIPGLVNMSAHGKSDVREVTKSLRDRVAALGRSHIMTLNAAAQADGVSLHQLVGAVLEPYQSTAQAFVVDGPSLKLTARAANAMALTLHELATNAAKYGALSNVEPFRSRAGSGLVTIRWACEPREGASTLLRFAWEESGGPPVAPPDRRGIGTTLSDRLVDSLDGQIERRWEASGLRVAITLPLHA